MNIIARFFAGFLIVFVVSCSPTSNDDTEKKTTQKSNEQALFELLPSSKTGITFSNELEEDVNDDTKNILSSDYFFNGAGTAIGDVNNDGLPDVFMVGNEVTNRLYINKGDMQFEDVTAQAKLDTKRNWCTGATMADVNGDGYQDIYVCQGGTKYTPYSVKGNLLYINNGPSSETGQVTFTESAKEYGLNDTNISTHAAFFDYDKDGDLDCVVLNESEYTMVAHKVIFDDLKKKENRMRATSNLFRNDNGKFKKVTEEAGMVHWGFGLGLAVSDINDDGWPDIYIANDYSVPDFMYINNGDGTFTDKVKEMTNQIPFYSMGMDIADINNDGHQEIAVVDMAADDHIRSKTLMASMDTEMFWYYINIRKFHYQYMFNGFQLNNGNGTYSNIANMSGVSKSDWSWAALLADFDNDGFKDFFVSNGYRRYARDNDFRIAMQKTRDENGGKIPDNMRQKMYDMMPAIKLPNRMYRNDGKLHFESVEEEWGTAQPSYSNGAAYADLDLDGDLDLVVNNVDMEAFVYKNNATTLNGNHYLRIKLKSDKIDRAITNSLVTIYYGDELQVQELMNTRGYESAVENVLHFGLGEVSKIDRLEVKWNDGKVQVLKDVKADQLLEITKDATAKIAQKEKMSPPMFQAFEGSDLGVNFKHVENEYNDFAKEILLPQKQSTNGPFVNVADVNGDGLDDFFVGGAAGQSGILYTQTKDGDFTYDPVNQVWSLDKACEDMGSLFFDADGDKDMDLYIVSGGGGEFAADAPELTDRLYINTGGGKFQKVRQGLPVMPASGSNVKAADYDGDGDMDLFVGGRAIPGKYPYASRSYLLEFDKFKYNDVTETVAPDLMKPGLVTDFEWTDFDEDGKVDLVVVGEWMAPSFYKNEGTTFTNVTDQKRTADLKGWWYSVKASDIDKDGDLDFICGNLGTNNKFKASYKKPFNVYSEDFDENGTCDIVLSKEYDGKQVPMRGRQCSSEQMPFITKKFPSYKEFASASIEDILGEDKIKKSLHLQVKDFESKVLINNGDGTYSANSLPSIAQVAPINGVVVKDVNNDGHLDLITAGNMFDTEVETPRYDAGTGLVMLGDGKGNFDPMKPAESGFFARGNVKDVKLIKQAGNDFMIVVTNNNGALQFFKYKG